MILYSEKDYKGHLKREVENILGQNISIKEQFTNGTIGSALYRPLKVNLNSGVFSLIEQNSRGNFEKYKKGLLLRINKNQDLYFIAISYNEIDRIELKKGKEVISPLLFSPFRLLLNLGVPVRYARYFRIHLSEYSIERMTLKIVSNSESVVLDSNGYNYYGEKDYFKSIKETAYNTLHKSKGGK